MCQTLGEVPRCCRLCQMSSICSVTPLLCLLHLSLSPARLTDPWGTTLRSSQDLWFLFGFNWWKASGAHGKEGRGRSRWGFTWLLPSQVSLGYLGSSANDHFFGGLFNTTLCFWALVTSSPPCTSGLRVVTALKCESQVPVRLVLPLYQPTS